MMGYDDAPEPLEVGEGPGGSAAPPREVWIDLVDDAECDFAVAATGLAAPTTPSDDCPAFHNPPYSSHVGVGVDPSVEDVLLEQVEHLQQDWLASQHSVDKL
jgi:hypothetical protein